MGKEMANHSSILAWDKNGQRNMAGCSTWGCKKVGLDFVTEQRQHIYPLFKMLIGPVKIIDLRLGERGL